MINISEIPSLPFPTGEKGHDFIEDEMVDLYEAFEGKLIITPKYYEQGINGSINKCYLRKGAVEKLKTAFNRLPSGMTFEVFDSYRPIEVQQALYDAYYFDLKQQYGESNSDEEIREMTKKFVSPVSYDIEKPPVHNTGGAIDLTLFDIDSGKPLDMGTVFDEFKETAHTAYFESHENEIVRNNRRLLYNVMTSAGFTNLPTEWWHYDFGTAFWSFYTGNPTRYKGYRKEV